MHLAAGLTRDALGGTGCPAANQAMARRQSERKFGDCCPKFIGAKVVSLGLFILRGRLRSNSRTPWADQQTCPGQTKPKARIEGWDGGSNAACVVD